MRAAAADTSDPLPSSCACILRCFLARLVRSLRYNSLKAEGAQIMADLLMTNTTITSLKYAAHTRHAQWAQNSNEAAILPLARLLHTNTHSRTLVAA